MTDERLAEIEQRLPLLWGDHDDGGECLGIAKELIVEVCRLREFEEKARLLGLYPSLADALKE